MDIVVKGRNVEVPEHYRVHVADKLSRLTRYDRKTIRFDVELFHEPNRRQSKNCQRVEITAKGRGPVIRAEAFAADFYAALDCAVAKLETRLRKMHDKRRVHYGRRNPVSLAETASAFQPSLEPASVEATEETPAFRVPEQRWNDTLPEYLPGQVLMERALDAKPMTVDQALSEMELDGHDFYLFHDSEQDCASVVYRQKGFDYGLIRLS